MRGAVSEVTPALLAALNPSSEAPDERAIKAAVYALARDCGWGVVGFHARAIYCTFHLCFVVNAQGDAAVVVGGDSPVLALSKTSAVGDELQYFDDVSFSSAATGYAPGMHVLLASELKRELSQADRDWLIGLGPDMDYNLKYWRPRTVGEVIFNTWD